MKMKKKTILFMLVIVGLLLSGIASVSSFNIKENSFDIKENKEWESKILITETDGRQDYILIGEKLDATEGVDVWYDAPKPPTPPGPPFIRTYIYNPELPWPYSVLWHEFRDANLKITKEYQLHVICDVFVPTEITITWDKDDFRNIGYKTVTLYDATGTPLVNMKAKNSYTYPSDAFSSNAFIIRTEPFNRIKTN